jgi:hypothetical protein
MKYYGYLKHFLPVNTFQASIYVDEAGAHFLASIEGDIIVDFETLPEGTFIIKAEYKQDKVGVGDEAIFTYITEKGDTIIGTRYEMAFLLSPFLTDCTFGNLVSQIILSSFLKFHGNTCKLIDTIPENSTYYLRKDNLLPSISCVDLMTVGNVVTSVMEYFRRVWPLYLLQLKDLIFVDATHTYISHYKIDNDLIANFIDREEADSQLRICLLDILGEYLVLENYQDAFARSPEVLLKIPSIFKKDTSWLKGIVLNRLLARSPEQAAALGKTGLSPAILGFETENEMYRLFKGNPSGENEPPSDTDREEKAGWKKDQRLQEESDAAGAEDTAWNMAQQIKLLRRKPVLS